MTEAMTPEHEAQMRRMDKARGDDFEGVHVAVYDRHVLLAALDAEREAHNETAGVYNRAIDRLRAEADRASERYVAEREARQRAERERDNLRTHPVDRGCDHCDGGAMLLADEERHALTSMGEYARLAAADLRVDLSTVIARAERAEADASEWKRVSLETQREALDLRDELRECREKRRRVEETT
jgi:hypothetical protein